ncbi:MAG: DUF4142 domain-containing protein [Ramlibacter sp.]
MKPSLCVLAAAALLMGTSARGETEAEYATPSPASAIVEPAAPRIVNRPVLFAPASVATATKLTPERKLEFRFIKEQAAVTRLETDASRLALAKSANPSVRLFATGLISQNTTVSLELQHLLHSRGMAAPMLDNGQRKLLTRLGKLSGTKFDKAYMEEMASAQRDELSEFEKASVAVRDVQIKAWIDTTLPKLQYQQALVERGLPRTVSSSRPAAAHLSGSSTP